ncbi:MAG: hypothetical protein ACD_7C00048G0002 [uncultured bacterium]|nr:MAG: hypothetical protein ACD_7C00048G0002 [uncultured bacterium]
MAKDTEKLSIENFVAPAFGDEKIVVRRTMGHYGEQDKETTLSFRSTAGQLESGQVACVSCGYDHSQGMWFGFGCTMRGSGNPYSFSIVRCPVCDLEYINGGWETQSPTQEEILKSLEENPFFGKK